MPFLSSSSSALTFLLLSSLHLPVIISLNPNPTICNDYATRLPSSSVPEPLVYDTALNPSPPPSSPDRPVLFRERNGWCPYSERAWLAFELKRVDYDTILIDNMGGRPSWYSGTTPQAMIEGDKITESLDIVKRIDAFKGQTENTPTLYPKDKDKNVDEVISLFKDVFPKFTRPSSRAAFLFRSGGMPVERKTFERTLYETDELLKKTDGHFFCGEEVTAADVAWAPFLERYAVQLPALHDGLRPRDEERWPNLSLWYKAMEEKVPAYPSRVQGDAESWRRVLMQQGFGNEAGFEKLLEAAADERGDSSSCWPMFAEGRQWLANSPREEAAARLLRNKGPIIADAIRNGGANCDSAEEALSGIISGLVDGVELKNSEEAVKLHTFLCERVCIPRDMGFLPARAMRDLK
ncbi:hypothetical protein TrVE_jg1550 [Triparma verrucosa]|uniref:GST C-terminal domain-containing protein n=1 Tax=Triparma verrucosa TaxID=1606542 RepID=A0A9W7KXB8_9STRA|nr:hypothetical protein TrVE_jg1550 [Triparma verrucosa]